MALKLAEREWEMARLIQAFKRFKAGEFEAGEFEAAGLRVRQGPEIDSANGIGHFYRAKIYMRQKKQVLVYEHCRNTIMFAPDSKEAGIAQPRLGRVGNENVTERLRVFQNDGVGGSQSAKTSSVNLLQ